MIKYSYTHSQTTATTGFFACLPSLELSLEQILMLLEKTPQDSFLRRHLLTNLLSTSSENITNLLADSADKQSPASASLRNSILAELLFFEPSLVSELCLLQLENYKQSLSTKERIEDFSPLVYLQSTKQQDAELQKAWRKVFLKNITQHQKIASSQELALPELYSPSQLSKNTANAWASKPKITLAELHAKYSQQQINNDESSAKNEVWVRPPAAETAALALERLSAAAIIAGEEMRHESSLSPIGLQRKWNIALKVKHGKHNYSLDGQANTYGRGLTLDAARASCLMEMVERSSAYASISPEGILNKNANSEIIYGRYSQLLEKGYQPLDLNSMHLDRTYADQPLHFIWGQRPSKNGLAQADILVPLQLVYLFSNLDEQDLCDAPSSTGLATGNTMEEAKVAALTELLERDAEATNIYHKSRCFSIEAHEPALIKLLNAYNARGINVQFQDITSSLGFPCVKCFVIGAKGAIHRATGAGIDAKRALISALTETPFPFPHGPVSAPKLRNLPVVDYNTLPDYGLESPARNLKMLEELLSLNGLEPIYIDITRSDLLFPVVKAIIPGLHGNADLDDTAPVPPRLYEHYLKIYQEQD